MKRFFAFLLALGLLRPVNAQVAPLQTVPAQTVPAQTAPARPTEAELRAAFAQSDAKRAATAPDTQERSSVAQNAANLATQIAWMTFDAGKFEEAATWFARRASLRLESYQAARASFKAQSAGTQATMEARVAAAKTEADRTSWRQISSGVQHLALTQLQILAREYNDTPTLLDLGRQKLALSQASLQEARAAAKPEEINAKTLEVVKALDDIGDAQADLALFDEAEKTYLQSQALRSALPADFDERNLSESSRNLAELYSSQGDISRARQLYQQALDIRRAEAPQRLKSLVKEGDSPETKALSLAGEGMAEVLIFNDLGHLASESGDFKAAQGFYDRALQSADTIPQEGITASFRLRMRAVAQANIATLRGDQGMLEEARLGMEEAVKVQRALGDDANAAVGLANLSGMLYEKGDFELSRRYLEQALQIAVGEQDLTRVVSFTLSLASLMNQMNRLPEAERYATQGIVLARKLGNWSWIGEAARTMAALRLTQKQLAQAETLLQEAAAADKHVGAPLSSAATLELQGRAREANKDLTGAVELYKQAVALIEGVRSTATSESDFASVKNHYRVYQRLVQALISLGRGDEAFDYMNRSRSKQMQDALRVDSLKTGNKPLQVLLERAGTLDVRTRTIEAQLQAEQAKPDATRDTVKVRNLEGAIATTRGQWRQVVEQIKAADPSYEKLFTVKPLVLSETQRSIPPDAAFVMYVPLKSPDSDEEKLTIFLVTRESLKIFTPPVKAADLWTRIRAARRQIALRQDDTLSRGVKGNAVTSVVDRGMRALATDPTTQALLNEPPLSDNLTALYDMLIKPIESEIATKKLLAFIPTQLLYYLPMQALATRQGNDLHFLIEDKELVYLTGADVMKVVQTPDVAKSLGGLIAFGDPTGANLPNAALEVKDIAQIFPASTSFQGAQVTKGAVTDVGNFNRRVVHFATHGVLDSTVPAHSYILLSPGKNAGDEQLSIGEVWDLPLQKVDLVALSACDTAVGERDPNGTEITTLAEAFSSAGAATVLASLWSVADDSTKDLMVEFYRQLAAGKSKSAALRAAELSVMHNPKYHHPYFWAPFILMGDWR